MGQIGYCYGVGDVARAEAACAALAAATAVLLIAISGATVAVSDTHTMSNNDETVRIGAKESGTVQCLGPRLLLQGTTYRTMPPVRQPE